MLCQVLHLDLTLEQKELFLNYYMPILQQMASWTLTFIVLFKLEVKYKVDRHRSYFVDMKIKGSALKMIESESEQRSTWLQSPYSVIYILEGVRLSLSGLELCHVISKGIMWTNLFFNFITLQQCGEQIEERKPMRSRKAH